jgi:hypothetical protein
LAPFFQAAENNYFSGVPNIPISNFTRVFNTQKTHTYIQFSIHNNHTHKSLIYTSLTSIQVSFPPSYKNHPYTTIHIDKSHIDILGDKYISTREFPLHIRRIIRVVATSRGEKAVNKVGTQWRLKK